MNRPLDDKVDEAVARLLDEAKEARLAIENDRASADDEVLPLRPSSALRWHDALPEAARREASAWDRRLDGLVDEATQIVLTSPDVYASTACGVRSHAVWTAIASAEERLAAIFPPISWEGEVARLGAVAAALAAEDPLRAFALSARYEVDATAWLRDELARVAPRAEAMWQAQRQGGVVSFVSEPDPS